MGFSRRDGRKDGSALADQILKERVVIHVELEASDSLPHATVYRRKKFVLYRLDNDRRVFVLKQVIPNRREQDSRGRKTLLAVHNLQRFVIVRWDRDYRAEKIVVVLRLGLLKVCVELPDLISVPSVFALMRRDREFMQLQH